jgi:hypothetical protein
MKYKVLTLTQPWATLVAIGAKRIETRSWSTSYRGPLLIHAAAGLGPVGGFKGLVRQCRYDPFKSVLRDAGAAGLISEYIDDYPRGAIVAVAELCYCQPMPDDGSIGWNFNGNEWVITDQERAFGDYTPGRFAWLLADVRPLATPIPAKGALGLWEWEGDLNVC